MKDSSLETGGAHRRGTGRCCSSSFADCAICSRFGAAVTVCEPPIRAGEARRLRRAGELERFVDLATRREGAEEVLLVVDLDDDCAKDFHEEFVARVAEVSRRAQKPVHICFCVREYEGWFLARIDDLRVAFPDMGWKPGINFADPETIRGAKEALGSSCARGYKQTRDQLSFTKKLNVKMLAAQSRSFRKLLKAILGLTYAEIDERLAA